MHNAMYENAQRDVITFKVNGLGRNMIMQISLNKCKCIM